MDPNGGSVYLVTSSVYLDVTYYCSSAVCEVGVWGVRACVCACGSLGKRLLFFCQNEFNQQDLAIKTMM